ncbi:hypothetical protein ACH5RR_039023 [Cinchona calisaya]|uniref:Uncharacterized protein n=1 Tax=Cinchona calisaya TaxID=153742 RepID=A0ABD2Y2B9_9GENT
MYSEFHHQQSLLRRFQLLRMWTYWNKILVSGISEKHKGKFYSPIQREHVVAYSIPFHDRSTLTKNREVLDTAISEKPQSINFNLSPAVMLASNLVRSSFVISQFDTEKLKKLVGLKLLGVAVASAYVYRLKVMKAAGDEMDDEEKVYFFFSLDCRTHLDPPIPSTNVGNCLAPCIAHPTHRKLLGQRGLSIAAELIVDAYSKRVGDKEGLLKGALYLNLKKLTGRGHLVLLDW